MSQAARFHLSGHIQGTNDTTSEHCVPSKIWFLVHDANDSSLDCI